jgi:hypothetical protein
MSSSIYQSIGSCLFLPGEPHEYQHFNCQTLADIQGLSNIVLSAFAPGAQPKRSAQLSDSLDTSSADNCQKSLLSVIEAQIIPQLMQAHTSVADSPKLRQRHRARSLNKKSNNFPNPA